SNGSSSVRTAITPMTSRGNSVGMTPCRRTAGTSSNCAVTYQSTAQPARRMRARPRSVLWISRPRRGAVSVGMPVPGRLRDCDRGLLLHHVQLREGLFGLRIFFLELRVPLLRPGDAVLGVEARRPQVLPVG